MFKTALKGWDKLPRQALAAPLIAALALVAACDKAPEGQVVAVVNGDEVTLQEVNAELGSATLPEGEQANEIRNLALSNVVNRRLLAGIAQEEQIESSPEFIVRQRQMQEALLVQMLSQKLARAIKQPTAADLDKFIAENPQMFGKRTLFGVDQIRFQPPARNTYEAPLKAAKSMAEVVEALNRLGIRFERGNVQIDSAGMPVEMFNQISAIGSREPFIVPSPGGVSVSQIIATRDVPLTGAQARPAANNAFQQRAVAQEMEKRLAAAKAEAGIDYQSGFGPAPAASGAPSGAASGAAAPAPAAVPSTAP